MLMQISVYLCEIVKCLFEIGVVVVVFVYNYFLGVVELLCVDEFLIQIFKSVFVLIDVCVFDYFVVGIIDVVLFVECGLL